VYKNNHNNNQQHYEQPEELESHHIYSVEELNHMTQKNQLEEMAQREQDLEDQLNEFKIRQDEFGSYESESRTTFTTKEGKLKIRDEKLKEFELQWQNKFEKLKAQENELRKKKEAAGDDSKDLDAEKAHLAK